MTIRLDRLALILLAATLTACASAPPVPSEPRPPGSGRVTVTMTGFTSDEGPALIALFLDAAGWPDADAPVFSRLVLPIRDGQAIAVFEDVPAGPFAISVFHDANDDRELNANILGIPSEAYGFSRGARGSFGPPSFDEARLELAAGESKQVAVEVE